MEHESLHVTILKRIFNEALASYDEVRAKDFPDDLACKRALKVQDPVTNKVIGDKKDAVAKIMKEGIQKEVDHIGTHWDEWRTAKKEAIW